MDGGRRRRLAGESPSSVTSPTLLAWNGHLRQLSGYAIGLKFFFGYLADRGLDWREATPSKTSPLVQVSPHSRANVVVLEGGPARRSERTVNDYLAAVFGFYGLHARSGVAGPGGGMVGVGINEPPVGVALATCSRLSPISPRHTFNVIRGA